MHACAPSLGAAFPSRAKTCGFSPVVTTPSVALAIRREAPWHCSRFVAELSRKQSPGSRMFNQSQAVAHYRSVGSQRGAGVARAAKRQSGGSAKQSRGSRKTSRPPPPGAPSQQQPERLNDSQSSQPDQPEQPQKSTQETSELTHASDNASQRSQSSQPLSSTATLAACPASPSPSTPDSTQKSPPIASPAASSDSPSSSAPAAPAAHVAVAPREEVWRACLTTSGGLAVAGLLVRQLSAWGHDAGTPITDCLQAMPLSLSPASVPLALTAAAIVSAARLALLRLSPAFLAATNASNTRALSNLNATDLIWVSLLPGISEELLFRGALLPLVGVNAAGVIVSGAVFGVLHITGGRNLTFAAWASSVVCVYGVLAMATERVATFTYQFHTSYTRPAPPPFPFVPGHRVWSVCMVF
ncbi:unnamed protein product [Closterium sp. Yama58-4]|nr:unnamed protein product [Closterium sp. Yama58-4]